jgi:hypothetical protein
MIEAAVALDLVVTAALKAASSEVVKKSIGALSARLGAAFERRNHAEIKSIIEEEDLIDPVARIAQAGINNSVIVSLNSSDLSSPIYKTELFSMIMVLGFRISNENKMDVLLSGSLLSADTLSIFSTRRVLPTLTKKGVSVVIGGSSVPQGYYAILPNSSKNKEIVNAYKSHVKEARFENLEDYISCPKITKEDAWAYAINNVTAGSVYFHFAQHAEEVAGVYSDGKIKIGDFASGIKSMLTDIKDYPSIPRLSEKERYEIEALLQGLRDLGI